MVEPIQEEQPERISERQASNTGSNLNIGDTEIKPLEKKRSS